jgi:hypothetical protein
MTVTDWRKAYVTVGDLGPFRAEVATFTRWNGWAAPRFTREVANEIVTAITEQTERLHNPDDDQLVWDGDAIIHTHLPYLDEEGYAPERVEPSDDGWYSIGSHEWTWIELWCAGDHPEEVTPVAIVKEIKPFRADWPEPHVVLLDEAYCSACLEQVRRKRPEVTVEMLPQL